jgi:arylsulfatase A-like enzyme
VIFVSDNGFMQGEHRVFRGKGLPYAPASHVPMVLRGPGVPRGLTVDGLAGLQDLAPTILALTETLGSQGDATIDGRSLVPYLTRPSAGDNRTLVLEAADRSGAYVFHGIVRSDGWKYVEFTTAGVNEVEMYNLNTDPYEDFNLSEVGLYDRQQEVLREQAARLKFCVGRGCR